MMNLYPILNLKYILSMKEEGILLYVSFPEKKYQNDEDFYINKMK